MLQGGASLQFTMVPMNLLGAGATADYIDSGSWAEKAVKEAKKVGKVNVAATTKGDNYSRLPDAGELKLTPGAAYVHMTGNNTIEGTQWTSLPEVGDVPLVNDTSSEMFSRPIDVARHALIYAGAQKNLGPSGVTLVIIREDLLARSADALPTMLNYKVHAENDSLYNTPNTFGIYILGLTMKWLRSQGGLEAIAKINQRKAGKLYAEIDRTGFYRGTARKQDRSLMNVTFRLATEELEKTFVKEVDRRRLRRPQGPSLGRRHARVDLQRVPRGRHRRAGRVHARVRAKERLMRRQSTTGVTRTARKRACHAARAPFRHVTRRHARAGCCAAQVATCVAPIAAAGTARVERGRPTGGRPIHTANWPDTPTT